MQGQTERCTGHHGQITERQVPNTDGEQTPDLDPHRETGLLDVPQHRRHDHDGQPNPEQSEEAMEVSMLAVGVKVGESSGVVDGGEEPMFLLGSDVFARDGDGLH